MALLSSVAGPARGSGGREKNMPLGASQGPLGNLLGRRARKVNSDPPSWGPLGPSWAALRPSWGTLGGLLGRLGALLGRHGAPLGASWAVLGPSWAVMGPPWGPLGPSWGSLGGLLGLLGASESRKSEKAKNIGKTNGNQRFSPHGALLGGLLEAAWGVLVASWLFLKPSWRVLERSRAVLGGVEPDLVASWTPLGSILGRLGRFLGRLV